MTLAADEDPTSGPGAAADPSSIKRASFVAFTPLGYYTRLLSVG